MASMSSQPSLMGSFEGDEFLWVLKPAEPIVGVKAGCVKKYL